MSENTSESKGFFSKVWDCTKTAAPYVAVAAVGVAAGAAAFFYFEEHNATEVVEFTHLAGE